MGLFALGMAAAEIGFSQKEYLIKIRNLFPWGMLAAIVSVLALSSPMMGLSLEGWVSESLAGLAAACLIICCTKCILAEKNSISILRVLQSSWAVALGTFSYSLYLTHVLVLTPLNQYLHSLDISSSTIALILYTVTAPVSLVLAYAFYLKFERPFMSNFLQKRKVKDAVV
ncbi:MAG: acyltransferase [Scytonematopsis contorta HA4267-MV1]|nr:acyltransferase [Scytonematopsis contorta HA4267-MV1]